jgi:hypothetical protein
MEGWVEAAGSEDPVTLVPGARHERCYHEPTSDLTCLAEYKGLRCQLTTDAEDALAWVKDGGESKLKEQKGIILSSALGKHGGSICKDGDLGRRVREVDCKDSEDVQCLKSFDPDTYSARKPLASVIIELPY